jgi:N-(2-amino-2-carboxyethyl)-L-glutamate synthase
VKKGDPPASFCGYFQPSLRRVSLLNVSLSKKQDTMPLTQSSLFLLGLKYKGILVLVKQAITECVFRSFNGFGLYSEVGVDKHMIGAVPSQKTTDSLPHFPSIPLLGNTPVQPIDLLIRGKMRRIYLKLEGANLTGSIKARTAFSLLRNLEQQNRLQKGDTVVESSSGNLGVALAYFCQLKGYRFLAVVDPKITLENRQKMLECNAEVEMVSQPDACGGYLLSRLQRVKELCDAHRAYVWTDQYANPANPLAHYTGTAPEVYRQMHQKIDAIFVPVSTGGTLAGIGRFLREVSPATQVIGVDAYGSVVFGTQPASRKLTGIGSSKSSAFLSKALFDSYILVKDEEAFTFCQALYQSANVFVGGSSGAIIAACAQYLAKHRDVANVVCICADAGENYRSTIFNPVWIRQQELDLSPRHLGYVESFKQVPDQF